MDNHNIYDLTVKSLFDIDGTVVGDCLRILPFEAKRKLQKFVIGS